LSNHRTESSPCDATSTSVSASPSTSATNTSYAPVADAVTLIPVNDCDPSFWCHVTVLSVGAADRMSTSESPSRSTADTAEAPSAATVTTRVEKPWDPSFSYQATVSSMLEAESTSTSLSPSTSSANTDLTPFAPAVMAFSAKVGLEAPSLCSHRTESSLWLPTTTSTSESPSTSSGYTLVTPEAADVMVALVAEKAR
jgi:hypothetical protein